MTTTKTTRRPFQPTKGLNLNTTVIWGNTPDTKGLEALNSIQLPGFTPDGKRVK